MKKILLTLSVLITSASIFGIQRSQALRNANNALMPNNSQLIFKGWAPGQRIVHEISPLDTARTKIQAIRVIHNITNKAIERVELVTTMQEMLVYDLADLNSSQDGRNLISRIKNIQRQ